jgi:hypothetical protein
MGRPRTIARSLQLPAALLALAAAPCALAVVGGVELRVAPKGEPIPGAAVTLFAPTGRAAVAETDATGVARMVAEEGRYDVEVAHDGTATRAAVVVQGDRLVTLAPDGAVAAEPLPRTAVPAGARAKDGFAIAYRASAGLITVDLSTPYGTIYLSATERAVAGTKTTWGITPFAAGDDAKVQKKNADALARLAVEVGGTLAPVGGTDRLAVVAVERVPVLLRRGADVVASGTIPLRTAPPGTAPAGTGPETLVFAGDGATIAGPFDGDAGNTVVTVDGKPVRVVAESTLGAGIYAPAAARGRAAIVATEAGASRTAALRCLGLEISADKYRLVRGESTTCRVAVSGLAGIEGPVHVALVNRTPGVVTLGPSDRQIVTVLPGAVDAAGTHRFERTLTGVARGTFEISAAIVGR